jgi:thioredoxin-like negative regulator of GroEL
MESNNKNLYQYEYLKYKVKYINLKKKSLNMTGGSNKVNKVDIILFKADWCGHCVKLKPTWEKVKEQFNNKFNFITYDADKDTKIFQQYKVDAFPTIVIQDGEHKKEYDGPRDMNSLISLFNNLEPIN